MYDHKNGIHFRKVHKGDLHFLLNLKQESWWGTHSTSIINIEDQIRWYENISSKELYLIGEKYIDKDSDQLNSISKTKIQLGIAVYTEIDWVGRTCNISGSVHKNYRKMEHVQPAFEAGLDFAFEILNMHRVGAEVLETHSAAQYLEIGLLKMRVEGRKKKAVYKAGKYYDSLVLGLLREEWEKQERIVKLREKTGCCNDNFDHILAERSIARLNKILKN